MEFAPHTDRDIAHMLQTVGVSSIDELFEVIPEPLRMREPLAVPAGRSEAEVLRDLGTIASKNRSADDLTCFMGAGAYDHHVPSMVWALLSRGELATSYTPYQPELSQGVLQALFEYQTMVCELTGMDVSNAGLYDGGSALSEGVNLALAATGRTAVAIAGPVNPLYLGVLRTQGAGLSIDVRDTGWGSDGRADHARVRAAVEGACAIVVQQPNAFGIVEDIPALAAIAREAGAKLIVHYDLTTSGVLEAPGTQGADVVVGEGAMLGNHMNFGGPYAGILACKSPDVRRLPGRLVGETVDRTGRRAFVLTLQAREQHIRREKATSNICTNQTLNTLAIAVTLSWLGPQGLAELGEQCVARARYARERIAEIPGAEIVFDSPIVKEFLVRLPVDPVAVCARAADEGYLAGVPLARWMPGVGLDDCLLVAVTEKRTREDIDGLADAIARACKEAP
ncbi:MAG TPA: aminomethyl-transferring glycine dehydrogenase subunit GcvPA [Actinomycetota bacterium]|nr:aminomethyl-transferring glycine dehydrogenase subunit GcvPA [Actinomycetota bacterium]